MTHVVIRGSNRKSGDTPVKNIFQSLQDDNDICTLGANQVSDEENAMSCERCNQRIHASSQGYSKEVKRRAKLNSFCSGKAKNPLIYMNLSTKV